MRIKYIFICMYMILSLFEKKENRGMRTWEYIMFEYYSVQFELQ